MEKKSENSIYRTSRWSYLVYYSMVITVVSIIIYIKVQGLYLDRYVFFGALLFCILLIKITEVHRLSHHYEIKDDGLEKVEGIFFRKHKKLNYGSISQIHLTQNPLSKLFSIGTVELAQFSDTVRTEINNINKPKKFIKELGAKMHRIEQKNLKVHTQ